MIPSRYFDTPIGANLLEHQRLRREHARMIAAINSSPFVIYPPDEFERVRAKRRPWWFLTREAAK